MKKLLLAVLVFLFANAVRGQADSTNFKISTGGDSAIAGSIYALSSDSFASMGYRLKIDSATSYLRITSQFNGGEFLKVNYNGDVFFKPSIFCQCLKCKSFQGMKYLFNLYKK